MTTRTQQRHSTRWVLVFLAAIVAVLATILSSASASAATTATAESRVRPSSVVVEVPVGPPEQISAGQRLGKGAAGVVDVVATGVAANTGDHIVLGLQSQGLRETAARVGGRHLLDVKEDFRSVFLSALKNPETRFTVSLDGLRGRGTYDQVMQAVKDGLAYGDSHSFTNWELAQLSNSGRLPELTFVRGGSQVPNPFSGG